MNVTIKQLQAFTVLAREKSFTRAAARLRLSQSALTLSIRQLEREVGLSLFDRTTRSVELTSHATAFLPTAQRILDELNHALGKMSSVADREEGNVSVASSASFLTLVLAPVVSRLLTKYPGIRVRLLNVSDRFEKSILDDEVDFAVANVWQPIKAMEAQPVFADVMGVVCRREHPLALASAPATWSDLRGQPMVGMPAGVAARDIVERNRDAVGNLEEPRCEVTSIFALGSLIESGIGLAVLPALSAGSILSRGLVFVPLTEPSLTRTMFILKQKGRGLTPAALALMSAMMDHLHEEVGAGHIEILAPDTTDTRQSTVNSLVI